MTPDDEAADESEPEVEIWDRAAAQAATQRIHDRASQVSGAGWDWAALSGTAMPAATAKRTE